MMRCGACIVGVGMTPPTMAPGKGAVALAVDALGMALADAGLAMHQLDGLVAIPSLMAQEQFMIGHAIAQWAGLLPRKGVTVRTIDVGGAGPCAALLQAQRMVEVEGCDAVAVVAGDTVGSAPIAEFLRRADATCVAPAEEGSGSGPGAGAAAAAVPSPAIPNLYDRVARWQMARGGVTREQLAMCASLMTYQASHNPLATHRRVRTVEEVLAAPHVAPVTSKLECAKPADGGAALLVTSHAFAQAWGLLAGGRAVGVLGGGEASGPLHLPAAISEQVFSADVAAARAYSRAGGLATADIDYWGLYDCFPVCFVRAVEAVGLAASGGGGAWVEGHYRRLVGDAGSAAGASGSSSAGPAGATGGAAAAGPSDDSPPVWPVNTHGGLLGFGAPWEVPAMHSLIEAVRQLRGEATGRQVTGARRALVYGNGGVFSASAVVILQGAAGSAGDGAAAGAPGSGSRL